MQKFKILFVYIFLFIFFYFQPQEIGPITFSQLWKIPLFAFLFWQVFILRKIQKPAFIKWSYARATKNLFTADFLANFSTGIIDFLKYMMFPLMYEFASVKIKDPKILDKILLGFAQFVIISGVPFVFGLLESKGEVLDEIMNLDDLNSFTGVFQNPHASAITTSISVLILLAFIKLKSSIIRYPKLNYLLVFFGVYLIYLTFVRTGYAMFAIGLLILFMPQKLSMKQILSSAIIISILAFSFIYLLETNESFYNRVFDIRNGKQQAVGSGRLEFWKAAWDLWVNGNVFELLFGFGYEGLVDHIYKLVGLRIYAHNELFTQLGQNGLLGVFFFIGYLVSLFKFIRKRHKRRSYRLAITVFFLYVSLMMTQGGMWFELDVVMVLVFMKLELEQVQYNRNKIKLQNNLIISS